MAYISFKPKDYFNTKFWTGTGSENAITGVGFRPDFVWIKQRNATRNHNLFDVVRGVTKRVYSDDSSQEDTVAQTLKSFDSDGFTLGTDNSNNQNSSTYVSYNWRAGNSQGSANTDGTINTTYTSVNTTAGFSICKWTGTGSAGTIGHGLGAVPKFIIVKNVDSSNDWNVYHHKTGNEYRSFLNTTAAREDNASAWNDTSPTSSVFSIGTNTNVNQSGQSIIAYAFAEKRGFSSMGYFKANGNADGSFIYTGFKPAYVLIKNYESSQSWYVYNDKIKGFNTENDYVQPDTSSSENSDTDQIDILSNGFKLRSTSSGTNGNNFDHIYVAFASEPLVSSNNIPSTAR